MAEQRTRLSESERLALDFMITALREGDQDTASLADDVRGAEFLGCIVHAVQKTVKVTAQATPVVARTAQLAANLAGGGRSALADPRTAREIDQLANSSLEELLEMAQGGTRGYSSEQRAGTASNLSQRSTQELLEELRRRTSR